MHKRCTLPRTFDKVDMEMRSTNVLALLAVCALAAGSVHATQTAPAAASSGAATTTKIVKTTDIALKTIYQDADGKPIDEAAFAKAVKSGLHFDMKPDLAHETVTLKLLPAGASSGLKKVDGKSSHVYTMLSGLKIKDGQSLPPFTLSSVKGTAIASDQLQGTL